MKYGWHEIFDLEQGTRTRTYKQFVKEMKQFKEANAGVFSIALRQKDLLSEVVDYYIGYILEKNIVKYGMKIRSFQQILNQLFILFYCLFYKMNFTLKIGLISRTSVRVKVL